MNSNVPSPTHFLGKKTRFCRNSEIQRPIDKDGKNSRDACRNLNVNEEYNCALRTKSYADFFTKAQLLVNDQLPSSPSYSNQKFAESLLEPGQQTIAHILEESAIFLSNESTNVKALMLDYFNISAEASKICSQLLESISILQYKLNFADQKIFDFHFGSINTSEIDTFVIFNNPFPNLSTQDFELIRKKYSSILHHIKSKRRKVGRKMKMINSFNKATGICATVACGLVAMAAVVLAAHTLTALVMGPAIISLPMKPLKKKIQNFHFLRLGFLKKVREQLDVAAKGTYILDRDFDTLSRLVARLHDEVEHNKGMLQLCLERREEKFSVQVLRELKKSAVGFRKQVEELEEHVYLCLVTINRTRALVIREISTYRVEALLQ